MIEVDDKMGITILTMAFKEELTSEEFRKVKDLVCSATLYKDADSKQWFLLEIGGIMVGSKTDFIESAKSQGYDVSKGKKPEGYR